MTLFLLALFIGLVLLTWSSDKFVEGAARLAHLTNISPLVVGIVIVGFGTSAPELLVSANAAFSGSPGMALGNAIGSNIANIALILGATAVITLLPVRKSMMKLEVPALFTAAFLSWWLLADDFVSRIDGTVLMLALFIALGLLLKMAGKEKDLQVSTEVSEADIPNMSMGMAIFWTVAGLLLLVLGSRLLVWGGSGIASALGVSDLVIGLTIVAIGTSLPELAASLASARKGVSEMAVGNIVGSCLFNNLGVIGLAALIHPLATPSEVLMRDLPAMVGLYVLFVIFIFTPPARNAINRWEGMILLLLFASYQFMVYQQSIA